MMLIIVFVAFGIYFLMQYFIGLEQAKYEMMIKITTIASIGGSRPEVLCEKGILKKFAKFTGKHLRWSQLLIKLQVYFYLLYYPIFVICSKYTRILCTKV